MDPVAPGPSRKVVPAVSDEGGVGDTPTTSQLGTKSQAKGIWQQDGRPSINSCSPDGRSQQLPTDSHPVHVDNLWTTTPERGQSPRARA